MNQLSLIPEPPFMPLMPPRGSLPERALFDLVQSDITQLDWLDAGLGWRLAAAIKVLGYLGWELQDADQTLTWDEALKRIVMGAEEATA